MSLAIKRDKGREFLLGCTTGRKTVVLFDLAPSALFLLQQQGNPGRLKSTQLPHAVHVTLLYCVDV